MPSARAAQRYVDNPAPNKWSAIINAAPYRMTGVRHRDDASEMPGTMSAGRFALVTASSVVRGETGFGLSCPGDGKQNSSSNQQTYAAKQSGRKLVLQTPPNRFKTSPSSPRERSRADVGRRARHLLGARKQQSLRSGIRRHRRTWCSLASDKTANRLR
jgi:hypothetical protein